MDDIDLGRRLEIFIYYLDILYSYLLSLRKLNFKYLISMVLIFLIKYFCIKGNVYLGIVEVNKIIFKESI